ncbi:MAG: ABC transporter permease [Planctomycetota bacterium]|nr:ABC transporter permease [Planctomycetota bacterium]
MNRFRLVCRTLVHFWRVNLAVCLGVAAATAVLTGALLVGDSMRGSLRKISLDGLGRIDEILIKERFFREQLAAELKADPRFQKEFELAEPVILFPNASASFAQSDQRTRNANQVTLIGCRNGFWDFADPGIFPTGGEEKRPDFEKASTGLTVPIVLNEPLANDLGISRKDLRTKDSREPGPILTVQIPKPQLINADNPIGKKEDLYETIARLEVVEVLPAESIGRFNLHPSQLLPRILYLPMETVQEALQQDELANALLVSARSSARDPERGTTEKQSELLNSILRPKTQDLGLIFKNVEQGWESPAGSRTVYDYVSLSSDQLLLTDPMVEIAKQAFAEFNPDPVMTYLANGLELVGSQADEIPFSMVSAVDAGAGFELVSAVSGQPVVPWQDGQIVINSWTADDFLKTSGIDTQGWDAEKRTEEYRKLVGKKLAVHYFEPEASHGKLIDRSHEFVISDVAKVVHPEKPFSRRRPAVFDQPPTLANDPDLTPFVPGLTDQSSINRWDLPFKTRSRPQDDDYWQFFRTTPKAFVNLKTGQELWGSRFGKLTSLRIAAGDESIKSLQNQFLQQAEQDPQKLSFAFNPIKRRNILASSGSTPFDVLFLALSFFIIAAALILIFLLFRLGIDQKVSQLGLLSAVGLNRSQTVKLLVSEGTLVSLAGAVAGVLLGILYARLMVYGLTTWWVGAVMTSFMQFFWSGRSLAIGFLSGVGVSVLTIWVSVRRLGNLPVREMLAGKTEIESDLSSLRARWLPMVSIACFLVAIGLSLVAASSLGGESQAGAFMGGGFLMLTAILIRIWLRFRRPSAVSAASRGFRMSGHQLAFQNASRNPLRSTLTIGLVAAATFLIVAVSSFHLSPSEEGTGGFGWIGESSRPIVGDFRDPLIRSDLLGDHAGDLGNVEIYSIRFLPGDEAGCNNPFQAQRPEVLGMPDSFIELFAEGRQAGFGWAGSTATTDGEKQNPWQLLQKPTEDGTIPVVIDKNTAMYSLKIYGVGGTYEVEFDGGQQVTFRVVGFLANSTLQGSLIISERNFVSQFPNVTGYRKYLIRSSNREAVSSDQVGVLETELSGYGFDAAESIKVLSAFLAVQNTYLSTFQTLGAFGLLLGTFGLATVQMRNVVERRRELAVMQALGFSRSRLGGIVMGEHAVLLLAGMLSGAVSAMFSVVPHILFGNASVPLVLLLTILLMILVIGLVSGLGAVISSARTPVLSALRSED